MTWRRETNNKGAEINVGWSVLRKSTRWKQGVTSRYDWPTYTLLQHANIGTRISNVSVLPANFRQLLRGFSLAFPGAIMPNFYGLVPRLRARVCRRRTTRLSVPRQHQGSAKSWHLLRFRIPPNSLPLLDSANQKPPRHMHARWASATLAGMANQHQRQQAKMFEGGEHRARVVAENYMCPPTRAECALNSPLTF